jgi:hypothetical protein
VRGGARATTRTTHASADPLPWVWTAVLLLLASGYSMVFIVFGGFAGAKYHARNCWFSSRTPGHGRERPDCVAEDAVWANLSASPSASLHFSKISLLFWEY